MALYSGLSPDQALAKWYAIRQKPANQLTPEEQTDVNGNMVGLSKENPAAWALVRTGRNDTGSTREIFNPQSGNYDTQKKQGFWSHPESWLQVFGGAALGAPAVFGALGAGAGAGASSAATGAGSAATGGGMSLGSLLGIGLPSGINTLGNLFAARSANNAADRAAQLNSAAALRAAELESQGNAEQLAFLKSQEAERQREWQQTQDTNMGLFREREGRLAPYRALGPQSLGQLLMPIPRTRTLGAMLGSA